MPGAMLEVQLLREDASNGASVAAVLRRSFDASDAAPFDFDLALDAKALDPTAHYSLRATLRDARGRLAQFTPARVPVTPGDAGRVTLHLARVRAG